MPVVSSWPDFFRHLFLQLQASTKTDILSSLYNIKLWNKNCLKEKKFLHLWTNCNCFNSKAYSQITDTDKFKSQFV
jgi:hypothetical protein